MRPKFCRDWDKDCERKIVKERLWRKDCEKEIVKERLFWRCDSKVLADCTNVLAHFIEVLAKL